MCALLLGAAALLAVASDSDGEPSAAATASRSAATKKDREGAPLPAAALARLGSARFRQEGSIRFLCFSPDGRWLASGGSSVVNVWEPATGRPYRRFSVPEGTVASAVFLNERTLAWIGNGKRLQCRVWDFERGREVSHLDLGEGLPRARLLITRQGGCYVSSPDGIRRYGADGRLRLLIPFADGSEPIPPLIAVSADGRTLAVRRAASLTGATIELFGTDHGRCITRFKQKDAAATAVSFSPNGHFLASLASSLQPGSAGIVSLWDTQRGEEVRHWERPTGLGVSLSFSPNGSLLATGLLEGDVVIWDVATGREVWHCRTENVPWCLAFSPDGTRLAVAGLRGAEITLWDVKTGRLLPVSADPLRDVGQLQFRDATHLLGLADRFRVWDVVSTQEVDRLADVRSDPLQRVVISSDEKLLAAPCIDKCAQLWDGRSGRKRRTLGERGNFARSLLFACGHRYLVTGCDNGSIRVWDTANGKLIQSLEGKSGWSVSVLALSPDGHVLASAARDTSEVDSENFELTLWDLAAGRQIRTLPNSIVRPALAFSPDGKMLACASSAAAKVTLWGVQDGQEIRPPLDAGPSECIAFSPDGRLLATAGSDGTVRLWELASGGLRAVFVGHQSPILSIVFSPDARLLASASAEAPIYVWDLSERLASQRRLSQQGLEECWKQLAGKDAAAAWTASRQLSAAAEQALPFLRKHLQPASPPDKQAIRRLVGRLDSRAFSEREKAAADLAETLPQSRTLLRVLLPQMESAEVRVRLQRIVDQPRWYATHTVRQLRALEAVERMQTPAAVALISELASGAADDPLTRDARATLQRLGATSPPP